MINTSPHKDVWYASCFFHSAKVKFRYISTRPRTHGHFTNIDKKQSIDCFSYVPELNLALDRGAVASATLWNYRPSMAVDGDGSTCSVTPRTSEQRWWQVDLEQETAVGAVSLQLGQGENLCDCYSILTKINLFRCDRWTYSPIRGFSKWYLIQGWNGNNWYGNYNFPEPNIMYIYIYTLEYSVDKWKGI